MSPVHVIVGEDPRAEQMWAHAFAGAVDLYRFDRNVEAFERLTSAQAPIDLIVLTPAQRGPFNLTPDQFVARVLDGALASSPALARLHVVVVGVQLEREHPRAIAVPTLEAAIRLVKFGEATPMPRRVAAEVSASAVAVEATHGSSVAANVISRIWAAADAAEVAAVRGGGPTPAMHREVPAHVPPAASAPSQLFVRPASSFAVAPVAAVPVTGSVAGGGAAAPVAEELLQPARPYALAPGAPAGYRGPALRGGQVSAASHAAISGGVPVPPALATQVQSMVYGASGAADPMLVWSGGRNGQIVTRGVPVPQAAVIAPAAAHPAPPIARALVPMEPPAGVYGGAVHVPAPVAQPAMAPVPMAAQPAAPIADPFLARAEAGASGGVQFG